MWLSKQASNIDLFFTRRRHSDIDVYFTSQTYFHLSKNTIRNNFNVIFLLKQTLRDIIIIFHDIAGLDMNLQEKKKLCLKAWDSGCLQTDRFARLGEGKFIIRNSNKTIYIECTPQTKPF